MAASAVDAPHITSTGQHRRSQDDMSCVYASPRAARHIFTICTESDEEYTPRAPNPELSRLEAKVGLVNLTSHWPDDSDDSCNVMNGQSSGELKDSITDDIKNAKRSESDDDLVFVTDKSTQTDDVFKSQQSTSVHQISPSSSSYQSFWGETSPDTSQLPQLSENELINNAADDSLDQKVSEAPTLKVEYVGKVWDAYIDDFLLGCDHIDQAAIYDSATAKCIACSPEFVMNQEEFDHLASAISCLSLAYKNGIRINGRHYKTVLADGKRGLMARTGDRDGCSACRSRTLVIIALHDRKASSRICNEELMRLGDFFWAKGL